MLLRLIRDHLGPYLPSAAAVAVLQLVQTVMALFLPTLNADLVDRGVVLGDTDHILRVGAAMLAVTAVQVVAAVGAVYFGARAALGFGRDLRAAIFDRVQSFSARELARFGAASLLTRSTNDVQQVQMLVLMTFTMVLAAPLTSIGGIVLALRLDVPLSGLLVIAVPALASIVVLLIRQARPLFRQVQERIDDVARVMREQIAGIRVIRAFVRDDYERERFGKANADLYEVSVGVGRLMASMFPLVMLVVNVSSVGVVWFGAHRIAAGALQIGELTAFLSYLMQILMAVLMATFLLAVVPRAEVCAERIREVLDTRSSVVPPVDPIRTLPEPGKLELAGVGFRYPGAGEPVLSDVDLVARPGEVTAVIGSTGSGKTTLLDLACRLIDPTHGAVRIGGVDAKDLDPVVLSATIGLVPQRPYLFGGTVASNLRYGRPDATDAELWHALDVAQARDFVEAMPGGLDAPISQGGTNVSGGQRQRLAIARALVVRPRIYLLDDAFSALDYATDAALRQALARETADATVVMVGQRVATIRDAHRIVVLDHGRVAATGTHDELMAGDPTYREIVLSQLTEEEAG